jgi:hypothetical protein
MSLLEFFEWLESTGGSIGIRESIMFYPLVESAHVLSLALFVGMIATLDLRLLGVGLRGVPVSETAGRLLPWAFAGFAVMVITGLLLFYSTPVRAYQNIFFRVKMVGIVLAGINALYFHKTIYRRVLDWDTDAVPPRRAKVAGAASLFLWSVVVVCGRMQAYNWFD